MGDEVRDRSGRPDPVERILRLVAEGKITPQEGRQLLEAIRRPSWEAWPELGRLARLGQKLTRRMAVWERRAERVLEESLGEVQKPQTWEGVVPEAGVLTLDVALHSASLLLLPAAAGTDPFAYRVEYHPGLLALAGPARSTVEVRLEGMRLTVRQVSPVPGVAIGLGGLALGAVTRERVTVWIPAATTRVAGMVHTSVGRVEMRQLDVAELDVDSHMGRVFAQVPQVQRLFVRAANGSLHVEVGDGHVVRLVAGNGRIAVKGAADDLRADTANGRILARPQGLTRNGSWRLTTQNGRVTVTLPEPPMGLRLKGRAANGRVTMVVPQGEAMKVRERLLGSEWEGERAPGEGAPTLDLLAEAGNGQVYLGPGEEEEEGEDRRA